MYKQLYILVEGNDDERFFNEIIKPLFKNDYDHIIIWKYAQQKYKNIKKLITSINSMEADYFFVGDLDENNCVIEKKEKVLDIFDRLSFNRIIVVIKEIEGWYLAGLDEEANNSLGIKNFKNTDELFKEDFNELIAAKYDSRIDFMREVLKIFSIETAVQKNESINYFLNKFTSIL